MTFSLKVGKIQKYGQKIKKVTKSDSHLLSWLFQEGRGGGIFSHVQSRNYQQNIPCINNHKTQPLSHRVIATSLLLLDSWENLLLESMAFCIVFEISVM